MCCTPEGSYFEALSVLAYMMSNVIMNECSQLVGRITKHKIS